MKSKSNPPPKASLLAERKGTLIIFAVLLTFVTMKLHNSAANLWTLCGVALVSALGSRDGGQLATCPGYKAANVKTTSSGVNADLHLAGPPCNAYGKDLDNLKLDVTVETSTFQGPEMAPICISRNGS